MPVTVLPSALEDRLCADPTDRDAIAELGAHDPELARAIAIQAAGGKLSSLDVAKLVAGVSGDFAFEWDDPLVRAIRLGAGAWKTGAIRSLPVAARFPRKLTATTRKPMPEAVVDDLPRSTRELRANVGASIDRVLARCPYLEVAELGDVRPGPIRHERLRSWTFDRADPGWAEFLAEASLPALEALALPQSMLGALSGSPLWMQVKSVDVLSDVPLGTLPPLRQMSVQYATGTWDEVVAVASDWEAIRRQSPSIRRLLGTLRVDEPSLAAVLAKLPKLNTGAGFVPDDPWTRVVLLRRFPRVPLESLTVNNDREYVPFKESVRREWAEPPGFDLAALEAGVNRLGGLGCARFLDWLGWRARHWERERWGPNGAIVAMQGEVVPAALKIAAEDEDAVLRLEIHELCVTGLAYGDRSARADEALNGAYRMARAGAMLNGVRGVLDAEERGYQLRYVQDPDYRRWAHR